jgi:hypothetical protein
VFSVRSVVNFVGLPHESSYSLYSKDASSVTLILQGCRLRIFNTVQHELRYNTAMLNTKHEMVQNMDSVMSNV